MALLQQSIWHLRTLKGKPTPSLESYFGKPLLLLFYSIGCPGCKSRAIPYAKVWYEQYGASLNIVGIHTHSERRIYSPQQIEAVSKIYKVPFTVFQDDGHTTFKQFGADGTPHWILLDRHGKLIRSVFGSMPNAIHRIDYALTELFQ